MEYEDILLMFLILTREYRGNIYHAVMRRNDKRWNA